MRNALRLSQCDGIPRLTSFCSNSTGLHNDRRSRRYVSDVPKSDAIQKTHYEVLRLKRDCSRKEIKLAFVQLSKECHPDKNSNDPSCHVKFIELNEAYAILVKPDTRSRYDYYLANLARNPAPTNHESDTRPRHGSSTNWNQDFSSQSRSQSQYYGFWEERDKSKDKYYQDMPYYGVKGVKKLPHWFIVVACCIFLVLGATGHYFAISYGNKISMEAREKKDAINSEYLSESRRRAIQYGNERQLEWLKSSMKKDDS